MMKAKPRQDRRAQRAPAVKRSEIEDDDPPAGPQVLMGLRQRRPPIRDHAQAVGKEDGVERMPECRPASVLADQMHVRPSCRGDSKPCPSQHRRGAIRPDEHSAPRRQTRRDEREVKAGAAADFEDPLVRPEFQCRDSPSATVQKQPPRLVVDTRVEPVEPLNVVLCHAGPSHGPYA